MKNNKTIYKFLIVAVIISLFASCKQDVIFYDISQEVEYETPIVEVVRAFRACLALFAE